MQAWMKLGLTYIGTTNGKPYKRLKAAITKALSLNPVGRIQEAADGYWVVWGSPMSPTEAKSYLEGFEPYYKENKLYAEGVYEKRRKPFPLEHPVLWDKRKQAWYVLGMLPWQLPYEQLTRKLQYRQMPRTAYEKLVAKNSNQQPLYPRGKPVEEFSKTRLQMIS